MQVLSQTHWLTQLLDMEVRDGHVVKLRGSESNPSCNSSTCTLPDLVNDTIKTEVSDTENKEELPLAEPISISLGPGT